MNIGCIQFNFVPELGPFRRFETKDCFLSVNNTYKKMNCDCRQLSAKRPRPVSCRIQSCVEPG